MAVFREGELTETGADGQEYERLDWSILSFGPVAMFRKDVVLADAIAWLERHGYTVAQAGCGACQSEQDVLWTIGQALGFHKWPSPNLNGFNDDCRHITVSEDGGTAVVLRRFEQIAHQFPDFARKVLDIFAWASWDNLLFGRRLLCLVQSEDAWVQFGPVGGREPWWNAREWLNADRA
jgi:hypothetical protein